MEEKPALPQFLIVPLVRRTYSIFFSNFGSFLLRSTLLMLPGSLYGLALMRGQVDDSPSVGSISAGIIFTIMHMSLTWLASTAVLFDVHAHLMGRRIKFRESISRALPRLGPAVVVSLACGLLIALGLMLLIVPGIMLICSLYLAVEVTVLERVGIGASLKRSRSLTRGYRMAILGTLFVTFLPFGVLHAIFGYSESTNPDLGLFASELVRLLFSALGASLSGIAAGVIYFEIRRLKEGMTPVDIAKETRLLSNEPEPIQPT